MSTKRICKLHPNYKGLRRPTTAATEADGCACHAYWAENDSPDTGGRRRAGSTREKREHRIMINLTASEYERLTKADGGVSARDVFLAGLDYFAD